MMVVLKKQERNDIKQRQTEGIALAKQQGKHLGRPPVQITEQFSNLKDKGLKQPRWYGENRYLLHI
ncbi:hypothetical protein ACUOA5_29190, partial [Escherichia coli]